MDEAARQASPPIQAKARVEYFTVDYWLQNWLEATGLVSGLLCVLLLIRQNIWNWPIGLLYSLVSIIVFYRHAPVRRSCAARVLRHDERLWLVLLGFAKRPVDFPSCR